MTFTPCCKQIEFERDRSIIKSDQSNHLDVRAAAAVPLLVVLVEHDDLRSSHRDGDDADSMLRLIQTVGDDSTRLFVCQLILFVCDFKKNVQNINVDLKNIRIL